MQSFLVLATTLLAGSTSLVEREVRSYDVRFLVEAVPQFPAAIWPSAGGLSLDSWPEGPEARTEIALSFADVDVVEAAEGVRLDPDAIIRLIRGNIAEDTWANERNSIEAKEGELLVVHVPEVHEEIARLLARLRARRARMFAIDVVLLPVGSLGDPPVSGPWISDDQFAAALEKAGERARRISLTAYNEQTVSGLSGRRRATVTDTEVNQTGVLPVVNPVVQTLPVGVSLEVRPMAVGGTDQVRLDLELARLSLAGDVKTRETFFAEIEMVPLREESLETTLLLDSRRVALAGYFLESRDRGTSADYTVLARVRRIDLEAERAAAPVSSQGFQLRMYEVGFLLEPTRGRAPLLDGDLLGELLERNVSPQSWRDERAHVRVEDSRFLYVTALPDTHREVAEWIDDRSRERAQVSTVEAWVLEGELDALLRLRSAAEAGLLLPADWRNTEAAARLRETFHGRAVGIAGTDVVARGFEARTYVSGVETVSGGTGFSLLETADPVVRSAGDGFRLRAVVDPLPGTDRVRLELNFERCATEFERSAEYFAGVAVGPPASVPAPSPDPKGTGGNSAPGSAALPSTVRVPYVIDLPRQDSLRCFASAAVPAGKPVILKLERSTGGSGRMVVVSVRLNPAMGEGR